MSLSPKDPEEKVNITFDFSANTPNPVTNPVVTIALKDTDTDIPEMQASAPVISGNKVTFMCQGGTSGNQYDVKCFVDIDTGEKIAAKDILLVKKL